MRLAAVFVLVAGSAAAQVELTECVVGGPSYGALPINCTATNTGQTAVAWFSVNYRVTQEGRAVPWLDGVARADIPGGIEPGESLAVELWAHDLPDRADPAKMIWTFDDPRARDASGEIIPPPLETPGQ